MSVERIDALMMKKCFLAGAKALESRKDYINELNVFPVPDGDTGTTAATGTGSGLIAPLANPNKWALPGGTTGGSTGKSTGMPYSNALSYAKGWKEQGMDANTIASRLMNLGASDDVIDRAMQNAGF